MVTVIFDGDGVQLKGHAPWLPGHTGGNIICAGISTLTYALVDGLREVANLEVDARLDPGDTVIRWGELNEIGTALVKTYRLGLLGIQAAYGGSITLN